MKPPVFDYVAPTTIGEAVSLLEEHDFDAKILSGGQSLMPLLNMRLARPGILIDLARIPGLDNISEEDGALVIGGMTRQRAVEQSAAVRQRHPLVHAATMNIAHPQNRNQGTVGGSLAHADPAAEYPATAVALEASFKAVGPDGERHISADDFFVTYLTTSLEPTEILTEVRLPGLAPRTGWSFQEMARRHGDFAMAGAIALVTLAADGGCESARLVLFGVGATAVRARGAEQMLAGAQLEEKLMKQAAAQAAVDIDEPLTDVHASADYRRDLAGVLAGRALIEAAARAQRS